MEGAESEPTPFARASDSYSGILEDSKRSRQFRVQS